MKCNSTRNWLKKRFSETASKEYLMNYEEVIENENLEMLFYKFDIDKSNTLDLKELMTMFRDNGIILDKQIVKDLFKNADLD